MTVDPNRLTADIADIVDTLTRGVTRGEGKPVSEGGTFTRQSLPDGYRWLCSMLDGLPRTPRGGGATICANCGGTGWVMFDFGLGIGNRRAKACDACSTARTVSDPTGDAVVNVRHLRDKADTAAKLVAAALANVQGAVLAVQEAFNLIDQGADRIIDERGRWPRIADSGEIARAREAQARRGARGEGFGAA